MTLLAKTIAKNKCWIVEDDGKKVASILSNDHGVTLLQGEHREYFQSLKNLADRYNIIVDQSKPPRPEVFHSGSVYGFPCPGKAYNVLWDIQKKVPVFTKQSKSKSFYCAGYYMIKINDQWENEYCPKLLTLNRHLFNGPFKTIEEIS